MGVKKYSTVILILCEGVESNSEKYLESTRLLQLTHNRMPSVAQHAQTRTCMQGHTYLHSRV